MIRPWAARLEIGGTSLVTRTSLVSSYTFASFNPTRYTKLWREKNIIVQDCSLKHGALSKKVLEMSRAALNVHFVKL